MLDPAEKDGLAVGIAASLLVNLPVFLFFAVWLGFRLNKINERLKMNQLELAAAIDALTKQQGKIAKEQSDRFDAQSAKIKELTDAINAGGTVSPEVATKLAELQTATQLLDDAIPDAPPVADVPTPA